MVEFLERLAISREFSIATDRGISDKRMAAQECILRFLAFSLIHFSEYRGELDSFLNYRMAQMNEVSSTFEDLERRFKRAMVAAREVFGDRAFRKIYPEDDARRHPINKALFETWSVNLGQLDDRSLRTLVDRRQVLISGFVKLMSERSFDEAVSQGTGDIAKVQIRFSRVEDLIREVVA